MADQSIVADFRRRRARVGAQTSRRRAHDLLRSGIRTGVVKDHLVEDSLSNSLWSSRNAVRDALHMLVEEGIITRQPRHGTVIVGRIASVPLQELMPPPTGGSGDVRVRVESLETRRVPMNCVLAASLHTEQDSVLLTEQCTWIDDEPVSLRTSYLDTDMGPEEAARRLQEIDRTPMPSSDAFELFFGVGNGAIESTIEAVPGESEACRILGLPEGAPVLFRQSVHRDIHGRSRLLVFTHYRGDRIALSTVADVGGLGCQLPHGGGPA
jgi:GntR family transcriptional regulator